MFTCHPSAARPRGRVTRAWSVTVLRCYGVAAPSRRVCHARTHALFSSRKMAVTPQQAIRKGPSTTPFPVLRGSRPVTAARNSRAITPDRGAPRRATARLERPVCIPARASPDPRRPSSAPSWTGRTAHSAAGAAPSPGRSCCPPRGGRCPRHSERMGGKLRWEWDRCAEGAVSASAEAPAPVIWL